MDLGYIYELVLMLFISPTCIIHFISNHIISSNLQFIIHNITYHIILWVVIFEVHLYDLTCLTLTLTFDIDIATLVSDIV